MPTHNITKYPLCDVMCLLYCHYHNGFLTNKANTLPHDLCEKSSGKILIFPTFGKFSSAVSLPIRQRRMLGEDPLVSHFKSPGTPIASFVNVQVFAVILTVLNIEHPVALSK